MEEEKVTVKTGTILCVHDNIYEAAVLLSPPQCSFKQFLCSLLTALNGELYRGLDYQFFIVALFFLLCEIYCLCA